MKRLLQVGFMAAAVLALTGRGAPAASGTWSTAGGGSWAADGNWSGGTIADGAGNTADFSTLDIPADATVTLDRALTIGNLTFGDTTPSHNWILNAGTGDPLTLDAGGTPALTVNNQTATIGLALAGAKGWSKSGSGTLALSGNNSGLSGAVTVSAGTVTVGHVNALGTGAVTVSGATLSLAGNNVANAIALTGGTLSVSSAITYASPITLNAGSNTLSPSAAYAAFSGKLTGTGGFTVSGYAGLANAANDFQGNVTVNAGSYLRTDAAEVIPDTASLALNGYLKFQVSGATETLAGLSGSGEVFINSPGSANDTLRVGAGNATSSFSGTLVSAGQPVKSLALVKIGTGTLTLSGGGSTYAGGTTISAGAILLGNAAALGAGSVTLDGGTLNIAGYSVSNGITLNNVAGNTVLVTGNYMTLSGKITGAGGVTFGGSSIPGFVLSNAANDFQGSVTVNSGVYLRLDANEVIPDTATLAVPGSLRLEGNNRTETIAGLNSTGGAGDVFAVNTGGTSVLRIGYGDVTSAYTGAFGTHGNLNINLVKIGNGTLTLSGTCSHTSGTTVNAGTLQVGTGSGTAGAIAGNISVASGATLKYNYGAAGVVYGGRLSGLGTLYVTGSNDLQLSGDNSGLTGPVVVDGAGAHLRMRNDNALGGLNAITLLNGGSVSIFSYVSYHNIKAGSLASTNPATWVRVGGPGQNKGLIVGGNDQSTLFAGVIKNDAGGTGFLTKVGAGTLTLTGTSSYDGPTTYAGGTVSIATLTGGNTDCPIGGANGFAANQVFNGGRLQYTGATLTVNRPFTVGAGGGALEVTNPATTLTLNDTGGSDDIAGTNPSGAMTLTGAGNGAIDNEILATHTGGLVKSGTGAWTLTRANAYGGGTLVSQGTLRFGNGSGLGSGAVLLCDAASGANDVALLANAAVAVNNSLTVANLGSGTVTLGTDNISPGPNNTQFGGTLTFNRSVVLQAGSTDRTTFGSQLTGAGSVTVTSPFAVNRRIVLQRTAGSANDFLGNLTLGANAELQIGVADSIGNRTIPDTAGVAFNAGSRLRFAPAGSDGEALGTLSSLAAGAGTVDVFTGAGTFTLTVGGDNASGAYGGSIQNSSGTLALVKTGTGTQTLDGNNTYGGTTTINGGALLVNGTHNAVSTYTVTSGMLGGTGTVYSAVNVGSTGALAPGGTNVTGRLTVQNSVTLASGAVFHVDIQGATAGAQAGGYDQLAMTTGTLDLNNATLTLRVPASTTLPYNYDIVLATGFTTLASGRFAGLVEGTEILAGPYAFIIRYDGPNRKVYLTSRKVDHGSVFSIK